MIPYHVHHHHLMTSDAMQTNFSGSLPTAYCLVYRAEDVHALLPDQNLPAPSPRRDTAGELAGMLATTLTEQPCLHTHPMHPTPIQQGLCPRCITLRVTRLFEQLGYDTLRAEYDRLQATNLKMTELCLEARDRAAKLLTTRSVDDFDALERLTAQLNRLPEEFCPISSRLIAERHQLTEQLAQSHRHLEDQRRMTAQAVQREHRAKRDHLTDQLALARWIQAAHRCGIGDPQNLLTTVTTRRQSLPPSPDPVDSPDSSSCGHAAELQRLRTHLAQLQALIDGAPLMEAPVQADADHVELTLTHPLLRSLLRTLSTLFHSRPNLNYLEVTLHDPAAGQLLLTLRPATTPTPHDLRLAAEQEARILRQALDATCHGHTPPSCYTQETHTNESPLASPSQDPLDHSLETRQFLRDLFGTDRLDAMSAPHAALAQRLFVLLQNVRNEGLGMAAVLADAMRAATPANIAVAIRHAAGLPGLPQIPPSTEEPRSRDTDTPRPPARSIGKTPHLTSTLEVDHDARHTHSPADAQEPPEKGDLLPATQATIQHCLKGLTLLRDGTTHDATQWLREHDTRIPPHDAPRAAIHQQIVQVLIRELTHMERG